LRIFKGLMVVGILIGICAYAVYHFGINMASDKVVEYVNQELDPGEMEEVKQVVAANPELQQFLEEGIADVDESMLVYQTKEEAIKAVVKKVGVSELMGIQSKVSDGLSTEEQSEILGMLQEKLSEEEILALKVLVNKELN
jgi:divalent metal cation (Fe/Co/Zn/Cd) transporter